MKVIEISKESKDLSNVLSNWNSLSDFNNGVKSGSLTNVWNSLELLEKQEFFFIFYVLEMTKVMSEGVGSSIAPLICVESYEKYPIEIDGVVEKFSISAFDYLKEVWKKYPAIEILYEDVEKKNNNSFLESFENLDMEGVVSESTLLNISDVINGLPRTWTDYKNINKVEATLLKYDFVSESIKRKIKARVHDVEEMTEKKFLKEWDDLVSRDMDNRKKLLMSYGEVGKFYKEFHSPQRDKDFFEVFCLSFDNEILTRGIKKVGNYNDSYPAWKDIYLKILSSFQKRFNLYLNSIETGVVNNENDIRTQYVKKMVQYIFKKDYYHNLVTTNDDKQSLSISYKNIHFLYASQVILGEEANKWLNNSEREIYDLNWDIEKISNNLFKLNVDLIQKLTDTFPSLIKQEDVYVSLDNVLPKDYSDKLIWSDSLMYGKGNLLTYDNLNINFEKSVPQDVIFLAKNVLKEILSQGVDGILDYAQILDIRFSEYQMKKDLTIKNTETNQLHKVRGLKF